MSDFSKQKFWKSYPSKSFVGPEPFWGIGMSTCEGECKAREQNTVGKSS